MPLKTVLNKELEISKEKKLKKELLKNGINGSPSKDDGVCKHCAASSHGNSETTTKSQNNQPEEPSAV